MRVVVIGATRGLGLALTKMLLAEGHTVAAGVRTHEVPKTLQALLAQYGDRLMVKPADVTNEEDIRSFADAVAAFTGKADAMCIVAGVNLPGDRAHPLHECVVSDIRMTFAVNTLGPILAVRYLYPVIEKGSKVLIITSEAVGLRNAHSGTPGYALSKTAATKVSGILNASVEDVDFYSVHPGRVISDMNPEGEIDAKESADGIIGIMTGNIPISRKVWYIDYKGNPMDM
jgi:NAD(P)-dependent dehydrogenase (short-subunit alcohol dehydrogenase family)